MKRPILFFISVAFSLNSFSQTLFCNFTMTLNSSFSISTPATVNGCSYALKVSGTYTIGGGSCLAVDGAYKFINNTSCAPIAPYPLIYWWWNGIKPLSSLNYFRPDTDVYNSAHEYWFYFTGNGSSELFEFIDSYYGDNLGSLEFNIYNLCNLTAALAVSNASICPGTCTNFTNLSSNATSYHWSFPGATPSSSINENPTNICYDTSGTYNVSLIATNAGGSDTLTLANYITVYSQPPPQGIQQNGNVLIANQGAVSYQWYYGGNIIPGATDYFYVADTSGDYNVVAIDANGCEVEAVIFDVHIGIDEINAEQFFSISPNPTHANFTISTSIQNAQVEIYNVLGEKTYSTVLNKKHETINCETFSKGIYFVKVSDKEKMSIQKLVVQ